MGASPGRSITRPPSSRAARTEAALAGIWSEVLGVAPVGRDDPLTHLGGDSLRAGPVLARISRRCGVELALTDLPEAPTVALQANRVLQSLLSGAADADLAELLSLELGE